ncbi:hypothetical protein VTN77DRAFT_1234 [Rasamsonia byssochlamydoides]|uniref:uncharacterized protein n=1 Tax=Rasamsonia byssochlamydoides TaxID=89139 RepID=UPI003742F5BF
MPEGEPASVTPAQLSFLAIYNPSLGTTDETLSDQIVFYSSKATRLRRKSVSFNETPFGDDKDDTNERLRQIGLAQGMVNFAKNFSGGKPVESVDTEKSRIVLHELEKNWWILASIDLTRLPSNAPTGPTSDSSTPSRIEYSSREVYPPQSLIQQLRRAHSIFLLHHDISLDNLYHRVGRSTFCKLLSRFWTRFIRNWVVLLNGNPAVDIFNGIKLAAGGELGVGVGEEEWGSGERAVLEDFVSRTDGLVDLVVSRFGDPQPSPVETSSKKVDSEGDHPWLGSDQCPQPSDGVIFCGVGAISRSSLCRVSHWMEWIYRYGDAAYGVAENPSSIRRRKQRKRVRAAAPVSTPAEAPKRATSESPGPARRKSTSPGIPPPLVTATPSSQPPKPDGLRREHRNAHVASEDREESSSLFGTETFMKYLTLGYGTSWRFPLMSSDVLTQQIEAGPKDESNLTKGSSRSSIGDDACGKFVIGLRDDLDENTDDESTEGTSPAQNKRDGESWNNRTLLRTLHLEMAQPVPSGDDDKESPHNRYKKLQVLVYVHRPFMFTFLFDLRTPSLTLPSFYRSIHHQLGPLQRPLLSSTSPQNASRRVFIEYDTGSQKRNNPIYDLVYDPSNLTVRSSIPNIPEPGTATELASPQQPTPDHPSHPPLWSRVEALNVHNQFLSTYTDTRSRPSEMERTCKTSRGWWLVWVRIPSSDRETLPPGTTGETPPPPPKEAFLVRKATDALAQKHAYSASGSRLFLRDLSGVSVSAGSSSQQGVGSLSGSSITAAPGQLAEGMGFDVHKYIESLLSLHR